MNSKMKLWETDGDGEVFEREVDPLVIGGYLTADEAIAAALEEIEPQIEGCMSRLQRLLEKRKKLKERSNGKRS